MHYARPGAPVTIPVMAMAPFLADPTSKKMFEDEHQRHRRALAEVSPSKEKGAPSLGVVLRKGPAPWPRPRSPPCELDTESYKGFRVRARHFGTEDAKRCIGIDNKKLVHQLAEIRAKPSVTGKTMTVPPAPPRLKAAPPPPQGEELLRKKQQREIQLSNEVLVKRITSVRSDPGIDGRKLDGEFRHHQDNVRRLQKVTGWAVPSQPRRRKQLSLPRLAPASASRLPAVRGVYSLHTSSVDERKDARCGALLRLLEAEADVLDATAEATKQKRQMQEEKSSAERPSLAPANEVVQHAPASTSPGPLQEPSPQEDRPLRLSTSQTFDAAPTLPEALRSF